MESNERIKNLILFFVVIALFRQQKGAVTKRDTNTHLKLLRQFVLIYKPIQQNIYTVFIKKKEKGGQK